MTIKPSSIEVCDQEAAIVCASLTRFAFPQIGNDLFSIPQHSISININKRNAVIWKNFKLHITNLKEFFQFAHTKLRLSNLFSKQLFEKIRGIWNVDILNKVVLEKHIKHNLRTVLSDKGMEANELNQVGGPEGFAIFLERYLNETNPEIDLERNVNWIFQQYILLVRLNSRGIEHMNDYIQYINVS